MKIRVTSKLERLQKLADELLYLRKPHEAVWKDTADYLLPYAPRFLNDGDEDHGKLKDQLILNNTGTLALNVLKAGMMSGITPPSRPWFALLPDKDSKEVSLVAREWLDKVKDKQNAIFSQSNLYRVLPSVYQSFSVFGTAAMVVEEDFDDCIRCQELPIGSYAIANDAKGDVNMIYREMRYSVRQLIELFGVVSDDGTILNESAFSDSVKEAYKEGHTETSVTVCHFLMENEDHDPNKLDPKFKKYSSCYWEKAREHQNKAKSFLKESGMDHFNVIVPRCGLSAGEVYGVDCPGRVARGDVKGLQHRERKVANALSKQIDPPLIAPSNLEGNIDIDTRPAVNNQGVTFVDNDDLNNGGLRPLHEVRVDVTPVTNDQIRHEHRINKAFMVDLFQMLANAERKGMTATEIELRKDEGALIIGPILSAINVDVAKPLIDITFRYMEKQGLLPPAPEELQGQPLRIEYQSDLAKAMLLADIGLLDRYSRTIAEIATIAPQVIDKVDPDALVDKYSQVISVPASVLRDKEEVAEMREQRAQQEKAQQVSDTLGQGAQTAKDLSQADMSKDNALNRLLSQVQTLDNSGELAGHV